MKKASRITGFVVDEALHRRWQAMNVGLAQDIGLPVTEGDLLRQLAEAACTAYERSGRAVLPFTISAPTVSQLAAESPGIYGDVPIPDLLAKVEAAKRTLQAAAEKTINAHPGGKKTPG